MKFHPFQLLLCCLLLISGGCATEDTTQNAPQQEPAAEASNENAELETSGTETRDSDDDAAEKTQEPEVSFLQSNEFKDETSNVATVNVVPESTLFSGPDLFINSMREWKDTSGAYSTNAELLEVKMKKRWVRLLKDNGVVVVVEFERLSDHDKNFVREFILYHRNQDVGTAPKLVERPN